MDSKIILIFCICDDLLKSLHIKDDSQAKMSSSEIITLAIVSALFFGGNFSFASRFLYSYNYLPNMLSRSRLNKKLLAFSPDLLHSIFYLLSIILNSSDKSLEYVIDSFPVPACHPCRSWRCKLYNGKQYIGYCASKKLFYYGLKVHMVTSIHGIPIEFCFTPASTADIVGLQSLSLDLPPHSVLYGDRAYNCYSLEKSLLEEALISLIPHRKKTQKIQHSGPLTYLQKARRKTIETLFSQIIRLFPRTINARTARCFELKIFLFILAFTIEKFC